jgi:hypothetical protein
MEEDSVAEVEPSEPVVESTVEPSEAVIIKKRGRPKGSLNKKTIANMREALQENAPDPLPPMVLDVEFTSDEILGEKPRATPKRKPPKARDPPTEPSTESDEEPVVAPPPKRKGQRRSDAYREPEATINPPTYLEILQRGLKEARAKQYAEKVAQYDRFFQW